MKAIMGGQGSGTPEEMVNSARSVMLGADTAVRGNRSQGSTGTCR